MTCGKEESFSSLEHVSVQLMLLVLCNNLIYMRVCGYIYIYTHTYMWSIIHMIPRVAQISKQT